MKIDTKFASDGSQKTPNVRPLGEIFSTLNASDVRSFETHPTRISCLFAVGPARNRCHFGTLRVKIVTVWVAFPGSQKWSIVTGFRRVSVSWRFWVMHITTTNTTAENAEPRGPFGCLIILSHCVIFFRLSSSRSHIM